MMRARKTVMADTVIVFIAVDFIQNDFDVATLRWGFGRLVRSDVQEDDVGRVGPAASRKYGLRYPHPANPVALVVGIECRHGILSGSTLPTKSTLYPPSCVSFNHSGCR